MGEVKRMLSMYTAMKSMTKIHGYMANRQVGLPTEFTWNEAIIDGARWNRGLVDNLWTFVLPADCESNVKCKEAFYKLYKEFSDKWGDKPILRLNTSSRDVPF